jgi:hypothetical protein
MKIRMMMFAGLVMTSATVLTSPAYARSPEPKGGDRTSRAATAMVGRALAASTDLNLVDRGSLTVRRIHSPGPATLSCVIRTGRTKPGFGRVSLPRAGDESLTVRFTPYGRALLDKRSLIVTTMNVSCTFSPIGGRPSTSRSTIRTRAPSRS